MNHFTKGKLLFASFFAISLSTQAHHSTAPHFDLDTNFDLDVTFTELRYVNPHAYIYFDEERDGEKVNWRCELAAATTLTRLGWTKDMFELGERMTVNVSPARREENTCRFNHSIHEDGTNIVRGEDVSAISGGRFQTAEDLLLENAENIERAAFLDNGQPNLQGHWISLSFGRNGLGEPANFEATEAGAAATAEYEFIYDNPILRCHYVNLINGWNHDRNVNKIVQEETAVTLTYGFMDVVRTIHLNQDEHPENITPSRTGHSIGWFEGDTLVVDTIGFEAGVLNHRNGQKHSDQMQVVERFYVEKETNRLMRDYTITDPLYLVGEASGTDIQALASSPYQPFGCEDLSGKNNLRPDHQ